MWLLIPKCLLTRPRPVCGTQKLNNFTWVSRYLNYKSLELNAWYWLVTFSIMMCRISRVRSIIAKHLDIPLFKHINFFQTAENSKKWIAPNLFLEAFEKYTPVWMWAPWALLLVSAGASWPFYQILLFPELNWMFFLRK